MFEERTDNFSAVIVDTAMFFAYENCLEVLIIKAALYIIFYHHIYLSYQKETCWNPWGPELKSQKRPYSGPRLFDFYILKINVMIENDIQGSFND